MIRKLFKLTFALFGAGFAYFLYQMAFHVPQLVETVYSRGIYPFFTKTLGRISAALPFSLAEALCYLLFLCVLFFLGYIVQAFFRPQGERLTAICRRILAFASLLCSLYTMFIFFWGFNYARMPLAASLGVSTGAYTVEELSALCQDLTGTCNALRAQVEEDDVGVYRLSHTRQAVLEGVAEVYASAPVWANLAWPSRVKGIATPKVLSYTKTEGIFSPFTLEPNINMHMPDLYFAVTAVHEYAHYEGFAREDEANFLSWYLLREDSRPDFAYSANCMALHYALNALYRADPVEYQRISVQLSDGIRRDFAAYNDYWDDYDTKIAETSDRIYESYLESNKVQDGMQSYGRMLDLMLALRQASADA